MLETQGLNELMRQDDQLIREIKELDTNMQMLVYENYNKFISATDTIRKMKVRAHRHVTRRNPRLSVLSSRLH